MTVLRQPLLQDLLLTLFGVLNKAPGEFVPVKTLVSLMEDARVESGAVRATLSRLKNNGVLQHRGERSSAEYAVGPAAVDPMMPEDPRVFSPIRAGANATWGLIIFSVPESERNQRYQLRRELMSLGFGFAAAGIAIAPDTVMQQALDRLKARDLDRYVLDFFATPGPWAGEGEQLRKNVALWWDLEELEEGYKHFLDDFLPYEEKWSKGIGQDGKEAFGDYLVLLTRWRQFPYRDPNISLDLLPNGWLAPEAKHLFLRLHEALGPTAQGWAQAKREALASA